MEFQIEPELPFFIIAATQVWMPSIVRWGCKLRLQGAKNGKIVQGGFAGGVKLSDFCA